MDGLGRLIGGNVVVLAGEYAVMRPVTLGMLAICENHLLALRQNPLDVIQQTVGMVDPALHEKMKTLAQRAADELKRDKSWRVVTADQMHAWLNTREGVCFTAWLCLRKRHSLAISPTKLEEYFVAHPEECKDFSRRRDICSGLDILASMDFAEPYHPFPEKQRQIAGPKYMPWRKIIRNLAEAIYWSPSDVSSLTLYSFRTLMTEADAPALGGMASVTPTQAREMAKMSPEDRKAFVHSLQANKEE